MDKKTDKGLQTAHLSVAEFWDRNAEGRILTMTRDAQTGYTGTFLALAKRPARFSLGPEMKFAIRRADLIDCDYRKDVRFSLGIYDELGDAVSAVVSAPLMKRASIPHAGQLELVLRLLGEALTKEGLPYDTLRTRVLHALSKSDLALEDAEAMLRTLRPGQREYEKYDSTGDVSELHAEREVLIKAYALCFSDRSIWRQLHAVIDNHEYEDADTVGIAIWALGRQNDKGSISYLVELLGQEKLRYGSMRIERCLQFLCSGKQLIPLSEDDPKKTWRQRQRQLPKDSNGWARADGTSVFWEKRLRCAAEWRASNQQPELLAQLRTDEVLPVRLAAGGLEQIEQ